MSRRELTGNVEEAARAIAEAIRLRSASSSGSEDGWREGVRLAVGLLRQAADRVVPAEVAVEIDDEEPVVRVVAEQMRPPLEFPWKYRHGSEESEEDYRAALNAAEHAAEFIREEVRLTRAAALDSTADELENLLKGGRG
jgi:hypothetical protein